MLGTQTTVLKVDTAVEAVEWSLVSLGERTEVPLYIGRKRVRAYYYHYRQSSSRGKKRHLSDIYKAHTALLFRFSFQELPIHWTNARASDLMLFMTGLTHYEAKLCENIHIFPNYCLIWPKVSVIESS